jgi:hypothetical protein
MYMTTNLDKKDGFVIFYCLVSEHEVCNGALYANSSLKIIVGIS